MAEPRRITDIAADYRAARDAGEHAAMARFQNEEACLVLLTVLERLAADPDACFVMGQNGRRFVLANASRHHAHRLFEDCMRILRPASAAAAAGR